MITSLAMLFLGICLLILTQKNEELTERVIGLEQTIKLNEFDNEVDDDEIGVD